jgi:two-component system nitrogen regulation response regulator NtrX
MIRLLIIDDNATFLKTVRELMLRHRQEFVVDTASDAEAALLAIRRRDYDVVVSDIRLHDVDGLEVLAECRHIRPDTSVIMITGYGDRELERQAASSGAYAFLHKPVGVEPFCAAVDRAALHSRSRRGRGDVSSDHTGHMKVADAIHRRAEAIAAQLIRPLTSKEGLHAAWAEEQAERIIDRFLDDEGSDDLLKLKNEIARALCRAYTAGKGRAFTHRVPYKTDIRPDIKP